MHVFKNNVHHDKLKFVKGQECPESLLSLMIKKDLVEPLPVAKAVEPPKEEPKKK